MAVRQGQLGIAHTVLTRVLGQVHALNKLPYQPLDSAKVGIEDGVVFLTYASLAASSDGGSSRLQQLVDWAGRPLHVSQALHWLLYFGPQGKADALFGKQARQVSAALCWLSPSSWVEAVPSCSSWWTGLVSPSCDRKHQH